MRSTEPGRDDGDYHGAVNRVGVAHLDYTKTFGMYEDSERRVQHLL